MGAIKDDLLETGAELRETHISWVFLTDRDAYKVKKPVFDGLSRLFDLGEASRGL